MARGRRHSDQDLLGLDRLAQSPARGIRIVVDPPPRGFRHACTVRDLKALLARVPADYLTGLRQIRLSNQVRRYHDRDADYLDGEIRLFPYPERLIFPASPRPHDPDDQEWLAWGARLVDDGGVRALAWTPDALRRYLLEHVFLHELGHHVAAQRGLLNGEAAAERIGREIARRLAPEPNA